MQSFAKTLSGVCSTSTFLLVLLPALVCCKAIPDEVEKFRDARSFDSLVGGGLGRDLSHSLRKLPLSQRSRMDTLTGFGLGRSFDNDYVMYALPPWMARPYSANSEVAKRNFDQIDSSGGMGGFSKRNFDQMDAGGMGGFSKRNFDKFDRPGFGDFNKRDLGKRNFDMIDKAGFGTFSRR
ncbi:hypothetical protein RvY_11796 [Ramazzottius varieornatus]|uniref:Orcokinin n=1 Tax=Ramazzottius varieornatus TaxID=947166 RepID=A0A1D1VR41_RAMVA|nr:hypothetical protein RvY_11796 [Ramazzottius varieornatus]